MNRTVGLLGCWIATLMIVSPPAAEQPRRFALLIGCARYVNLPEKYQLPHGPDNDVRAVQRLLTDRFGYVPEEFTILVHANDPDMRPSRANFVREMERLATTVGTGDQVVILFAGHGSQQPDDDPDDPHDYEADGLDELLLPEDVSDWRHREKVVGGITDDQIRGWLDRMRGRGAFVFFIADTCHSGTMTRGPEDELGTAESDGFARYRHVPPGVLHPQEELHRARERAATRRSAERSRGDDSGAAGADSTESPLDLGSIEQRAKHGGLVALYAVPDSQLEKQHAMPPPYGKGPASIHGRLTYALQDVLSQAQQRLTYRELAQQIAERYQRWRWFPYSQIEGTHLDREVLGKRDGTDRSRFQLARERDGRLTIEAGLVHGLTRHSILAVRAPIGSADPDKLHGYVVITSADAFTAEASPVAFGEQPAVSAADLPAPGRCEIVYRDYGDLKIAVRVRPFPPDLAGQLQPPLVPAGQQTLGRVRQIVADLAAGGDSLVRLAGDGEQADVYLLAAEGQVYLCLAGIDLAAAVRDNQHIFAPDPIDEVLPLALKEKLNQIAQGLNLRRLAGAGSGIADPGAEIQVQLERLPRGADEAIPVTDPASAEFRDGDTLRVTVTNSEQVDAQVSVYYQDSTFCRGYFGPGRYRPHNAVFPVPAGKSATVQIEIDASTTGLEDLLIFAFHSEPRAVQDVDLSFLESAGLGLATFRSTQGVPGDRLHPLEQLLDAAVCGGTFRGARQHQLRSFSIQGFSVTVVKQP